MIAPMTFTVPVNADSNHKDYDITVTVKLIAPRPSVSVAMSQSRVRVLGIPVPVYNATINAQPNGSQITRVEYSPIGMVYTTGKQMSSLTPITHFYIRVTTDSGRYVYEYWNGQIIER